MPLWHARKATVRKLGKRNQEECTSVSRLQNRCGPSNSLVICHCDRRGNFFPYSTVLYSYKRVRLNEGFRFGIQQCSRVLYSSVVQSVRARSRLLGINHHYYEVVAVLSLRLNRRLPGAIHNVRMYNY